MFVGQFKGDVAGVLSISHTRVVVTGERGPCVLDAHALHVCLCLWSLSRWKYSRTCLDIGRLSSMRSILGIAAGSTVVSFVILPAADGTQLPISYLKAAFGNGVTIAGVVSLQTKS